MLWIAAVLACGAKADDYDNLKELSCQQGILAEDMFCERVYRCLGIKRRYDTPDGVAVYEYEPKLQLHFASATGDAKNDIRLGTGFHTDFSVEPGMDDGMFITLDQRE